MTIERRVQLSGLLLMIGMLIELLSLVWSHPIAFLIFIVISGSFIISGIVYYLVSLITMDKSP